jgi:CheY-specific phosphatase CheX
MNKFFGQFLLERDVVSRDELMQALKYQRDSTKKLGEIAVARGYLTQKDVDYIHKKQQTVDRKFGELAITEGLLTEDQVKELMNIQVNNHILLGKALLDLGIVNEEKLREELRAYREEEYMQVLMEIDVPERVEVEGIRHGKLFYILGDVTVKMLLRIADIYCKTSDVKVEIGYTVNPYYCIVIPTHGDIQAKFLFKLSRQLAHRIASRMLMRDTGDIEESLMADAVGEFLNIVCGNVYSRALREEGKDFRFSVPEIIRNSDKEVIFFEKKEKSIVLPLFTSEGFAEIQLIEPSLGG